MWQVRHTNKVEKKLRMLPKEVISRYLVFVFELKLEGPYRSNWPNYSPIKGQKHHFHCHIKKGHPTYVVCWEIIDKQIQVTEVYYVGPHENTPY